VDGRLALAIECDPLAVDTLAAHGDDQRALVEGQTLAELGAASRLDPHDRGDDPRSRSLLERGLLLRRLGERRRRQQQQGCGTSDGNVENQATSSP
jgi:hypothetical protein